MLYICPECKTEIIIQRFCSKCGKKRVPALYPRCKWCWKTLWPHENFCTRCGRSRDEALNTSPPSIRIRIKAWIFVLFGKKVVQSKQNAH